MQAIGPQLPSTEAGPTRRSQSGSLSSSSRSSFASSSRSPSPSGSDRSRHQRTRPAVAGPQLPADFIRARSASASSDDEEVPSVGPSLPTSAASQNDGLSEGAKLFLEREARKKAAEEEAKVAAERAANSRPEWMLLPPSLSNASSLQAIAGDPLNLKSRGFAQTTPRVSARGGASTDDADTSVWTETPEERLRRMQDEVSGVKAKGASALSVKAALERERSARRDSGIAAAVADGRSGKKSLVEEHNERRRRELKDKLEDETRQDRRREKRRRHDDDDRDDRRSSRHSHSDGHRRRHRSRSRSPAASDKHRHGCSSSSSHRHHHRSSRRDDSHRSHTSSRHKSETADDLDEQERRRERRKRKESDRRSHDRDDRKSTKSRKEREEEDVRSGKAAAPVIWDRDAALSVGGRLMDEKKRGKLLADAGALGDRFGSGSRRFL